MRSLSERVSELRESLQAPLTKSAVTEALRTTLQRVGAHAVDRAVWHLGLGHQGIRLTGSSFSQTGDRWEAAVGGWKSAVVAEASEMLAHRALGAVFDLEGGESIALENMNIRWLHSGSESPSKPGQVFLEWSMGEREQFRRDALSNLTSGALAILTVIGRDEDGLGIVEVEMQVRARARRQISGAKA